MKNYNALKDMAAAHLENVKRKIAEINAQKQVIEEEIAKLVQYYETNLKELNDDSV
jgi:flagellar biosynthesis chaperone FliJ